MFGFGRRAKEAEYSSEEEETTYNEYTETASDTENTEIDQSECENNERESSKSYSKISSFKKSYTGKTNYY